MSDSAERREHAVEVALRFLNRRARTVREVQCRLEAEGVDGESIAVAIETLVTDGYLDDADYARRFTEDRRALDGWGTERIVRRLGELGIDRELVDAAVRRHDEHEELDAALEVLRRRFGGPPEDAKQRNRMLGVLLRKGYDSEAAYTAIRSFERGLAVD